MLLRECWGRDALRHRSCSHRGGNLTRTQAVTSDRSAHPTSKDLSQKNRVKKMKARKQFPRYFFDPMFLTQNPKRYIETDPFLNSVFPIIALMIYGFPCLTEFFPSTTAALNASRVSTRAPSA